jgi:hypothetical protein
MSTMMRSTSMTRSMPMPPMMKMGGFKPVMMRSTSTSMTRSMPPMMKMGGMKMPGMRRPPPVFKMSNSKATLINADQGPKYSPTSYGANNALVNNNSFTHTTNKAGAWWKAQFKGGEQWVWKVRI